VAYTFGAYTKRLTRSASLISNTAPRPITIGFRLKQATIAAQSGTSLNQFIFANNNTGGDPVLGVGIQGTTTTTAKLSWYTNGGYVDSANFTPDTTTWHSYALSFGTGTPGAVAFYRDGADITGSTTTATFGGSETTTGCILGSLTNSGPAGFFIDGDLADFTVWNVVLDPAEAIAFTKGFSGLLVRPTALQALWEGRRSNVRDRLLPVWTLVGVPTAVDGPPSLMPRPPQIPRVGVAVTGTTVTLDTGAVTKGSADVLAAVKPVLDTKAIAAPASADVLPRATAVLDTKNVAVASSNLLAAAKPVLDTKNVAAAGNNLTTAIAVTVTLDTKGVAVASSDVLAAIKPVLDTRAVTTASTEILPRSAAVLDSRATAVSGNNLTAGIAVTVTLDSATAVVSSNLAPQLQGWVKPVLDSKAVTVAGFDLTPRGAAVLDTRAIAVASTELTARSTAVIDSKGVAVAGADLVTAVAGTVTLDTKAITVASTELTPRLTTTLDSKGVAVAGSNVLAAAKPVLDTRAIVVAGNNLSTSSDVSVLLGTGAVAVASSNIQAWAKPVLATGNVAVAGSDMTAIEGVAGAAHRQRNQYIPITVGIAV
jgi:hypothetical protein